MFNVIGGENCQLCSHSNAVVGTEGCTVGCNPVAIHVSLYGIFIKIELFVGVFLAHHVHVSLQHYRRCIFISL